MKVKGSRRLVKRLGLALAVAAFAAPAAQAMPADPDTQLVVQPRLYADDLHVAVPSVPISQRLYADDRHEVVSISPVSNVRRFAPINIQARPDLVQPVSDVGVEDSTSFNWADAGIGAGGALGLLLLGGGALLAGRHTRRSRVAAI